MKPSSAIACVSPRAAENCRLPTLPVCGPGIDVVDDRIFLRRIEIGRPVHQAVKQVDAAAILDGDRHRRLPSRREQPADVHLLELQDDLAGLVAKHRGGRLRRASRSCRRRTYPTATARRRDRHLPASAAAPACRPSPGDRSAGSTDRGRAPCRRPGSRAVRVGSSTRSSCVTLPSPLVIGCFNLPVCRSCRYSWPQLSRCENQIASFEPGKYLPVDASVARLEEGLALFLEHVADRAGRRVGDAQVRLLMVARRRDERDLAAVRAPLHVDPLAAALDVVAQCRAVLILAHLQADDLRAVDLDDRRARSSSSFSSPGSGYFQARNVGCPAAVLTRYMSPVLR